MIWKKPSERDVAVATYPVSRFFASTVAPGKAPPSASMTVPVTRPVVTSVCARAGSASAKVRIAIQMGSARHRADRVLHIELLLIRSMWAKLCFRHDWDFGRNLHEVVLRREGFLLWKDAFFWTEKRSAGSRIGGSIRHLRHSVT